MIGGWKKFKDFLENHLQFYIPPKNDFTANFGLKLLSKKKKVFTKKEVAFVTGVPKEEEFGIKNIKKMIKEDKEVLSYLPDYSKKHRPDKNYLLNVINTVHKGSV